MALHNAVVTTGYPSEPPQAPHPSETAVRLDALVAHAEQLQRVGVGRLKGDLDLVQPRPVLAGDEYPVGRRVPCNACNGMFMLSPDYLITAAVQPSLAALHLYRDPVAGN